jgi:hypothetical protein
MRTAGPRGREEELSTRPSAPWISLNHNRIRKLLIGVVGTENNGARDFKDLRGTRRNTSSLKSNDREHEEILIAPLKLPRFFRIP